MKVGKKINKLNGYGYGEQLAVEVQVIKINFSFLIFFSVKKIVPVLKSNR